MYLLKNTVAQVRHFLRSNVNGNVLEVFHQDKTKSKITLLTPNIELRKRYILQSKYFRCLNCNAVTFPGQYTIAARI